MTSKRPVFLLAISIVLVASSCVMQTNQAAPTSTAFPVTSTFPAESTFAASGTPLPPLPQPMAPSATPIEGTTSTQINVRSEPSTSGSILGVIPPNTTLQIIGKDPGGNWWQIIYEGGVEGKGWVTAQYVTTANPDAVPVIGGNSIDPNDGVVAIVQQQINVRSGPGTSFNSLGTLNAQDVVNLTGKDPNGAWLQIAFAAGPEGKGWVNAAFVRAQGVENLPIITEAGQVVGTGTPTGIPATPTSTIIPAWEDHDSQDHPVANITLEADGTHVFIYNGDISSPQGDSEDWINFQPHSQIIFAELTCTGNTSVQADVFENGAPMNLHIACDGGIQQISVKPNASYLIRLYIGESAATLQYFQYTIKIQSSQ